MGEFTMSDQTLKQKKRMANHLLNDCDGLKVICVLFNSKI